VERSRSRTAYLGILMRDVMGDAFDMDDLPRISVVYSSETRSNRMCFLQRLDLVTALVLETSHCPSA